MIRQTCTLFLVLSCTAQARGAEFSYVRPEAPARYSCVATAGWQADAFDDRAWTELTLPAPAPAASAGSSLDAGVTCAGTRFQRWRFEVGSEADRATTLTLRARYQHGFVAYLNGVEIVRRRLDANADAAALANETHGPEADRIFVPVRAGMLHRGSNVLAIEVHPRTPGHQPVLEVDLSSADGPRIVRGPYLSRLSDTEVTILFDTDVPTVAELRYGSTDSYGAAVVDNVPSHHHVAKVSGLRPASSYHYRASVRSPTSSPMAQLDGLKLPPPADGYDAGDTLFHTPPEAGHPLRFVAYGDVRSGHEIHAQLNRSMLDDDPDLAVVTGDLVDRGSDEGDWEKFFEIAGPLLRQVAIFPAIGNHEYARLGHGAQTFFQLFRTPLPKGDDDPAYYSFDIGGVHFVALDSNQYRSARQLRWVDQDLAAARRRSVRAIFVYAHEGPYSSGLHGDNSVCVRDYVPVFERHHVNLFIGGHDHHYERGHVGNLDYLITGGGGAELRSQRCGVPGRRACPPRVLSIANEHHYVLVEVLPEYVRLCPKRPDGTPLEPCSTLPIKR